MQIIIIYYTINNHDKLYNSRDNMLYNGDNILII